MVQYTSDPKIFTRKLLHLINTSTKYQDEKLTNETNSFPIYSNKCTEKKNLGNNIYK